MTAAHDSCARDCNYPSIPRAKRVAHFRSGPQQESSSLLRGYGPLEAVILNEHPYIKNEVCSEWLATAIRAEGVSAAEATDARLARLIRLASQYVDRMTQGMPSARSSRSRRGSPETGLRAATLNNAVGERDRPVHQVSDDAREQVRR
jgi:hypothetical protein